MPTTRPTHERPIAPAEAREADERDNVMARRHKAMRDRVRVECFDTLAASVTREKSAMAMKDLKDFMKGLSDEALDENGLADDTKKMAALENLYKHAARFAKETDDLGEQVMTKAKEARGDDLLTDTVLARWYARLKERTSDETWVDTRRKIQKFLDNKKFSKDWQQLRRDLKDIKNQRAELGISARDMKELATLETDDFKNAKFPKQRVVDDALTALRKRRIGWKKRPRIETEGSKFYSEVRALLKEAVHYGWMSRAKMGEWLKRTFSGRNFDQVKDYVRTTLKPNRNRWKAVRERYDALHGEIRDTGVPRGFSPVDPETFLRKNYDQRAAYVRMLESRLHPQGKPATLLRKAIWHAFDAEDWYDAEHLIGVLEGAFPSHPDLGPMVRYLASHRDDLGQESKDKKEGPSDQEIVQETNTLVRRYPQMDILLTESLRKDTQNPQDLCARTRLVGRMMYNLVWAEQRGYTSEEEQFEEIRDAEYQEQTEEYIEEGHSDDVEKNMVWGKTADKHAIREDCSSAQIIYMESNAESQHVVAGAVDKLKNNEKFGYWSDLKPIGMDNGHHHFFVQEDSKKLKKLAWQMRDRGIVYNRATTPQYRGDMPAKESPAKKPPTAVAAKPQPMLS